MKVTQAEMQSRVRRARAREAIGKTMTDSERLSAAEWLDVLATWQNRMIASLLRDETEGNTQVSSSPFGAPISNTDEGE